MTSLQVLVVDDEPAIRQVVAANLRKAGYSVEQADSGNAALKKLLKGDVDVALCDIKMPDLNGMEVLHQARAAGIDTAIIMMTAYASVDTAIEAMKAGAVDYMIKPLNNEELLYRLSKVGDMRDIRAENQVLRKLVQGTNEDVFRFKSPVMCEIERMVAKVAPTDSTVLITGESGTGKGVTARLIHQQSQRADAPFIPVNCGAIPENLMESELFGHTRGAFTGADKARKGLFLEADRGSIFLDEIGELPLVLQVKLLHVIEHKEVRPVGSEQARRVNVRIIAATNRDLGDMAAQGQFRQDLFFRLNVFHIHEPPLRERREDLLNFIRFLFQRNRQRQGNGRRLLVDPAVEEILVNHDWPGNVRELENIVDRALIMADGDRVTLADLPPQITKVTQSTLSDGVAPSSGTLREQVRKYEAVLILRTIEEADGDRRVTAERLGIGLSSLYRKLEEFEDQGLLPEGDGSRHEPQQP